MLAALIFVSGILGGLFDTTLQTKGNNRVVGGYEVRPKFKYPWMVSLQRDGAHSCGGTLFSSTKIVTAAHCVYETIERFTAKVHRHDLQKSDSEENGQTFNIRSRVVHPNYTSVDKGYDVSVWTLQDTDVLGVKLSEPKIKVLLDPGVLGVSQINYLVVGWGRLSEGGIISPTLMEVVLPYVDPAACQESYIKEDLVLFNQSQICAGFLEDAGQGKTRSSININQLRYLPG